MLTVADLTAALDQSDIAGYLKRIADALEAHNAQDAAYFAEMMGWQRADREKKEFKEAYEEAVAAAVNLIQRQFAKKAK